MNEMNSKLLELKTAAESYVKSIRLDSAIRSLCYEGVCDNAKINFSVEIELPDGKVLDLRCTSGAGVNGAYARVKKPYDKNEREFWDLYCCTDYGKHLDVFRNGEWVRVVLSAAKREGIAQQAVSQAKELRRIQTEISKFLPI